MSTRILLGILLVVARAASGVEVSPISVRVEQVVKGDHTKFAHTQEKSLKVFLTNGSDRDFAAVSVKYFFFARDVAGGDIILHERGEKSAQVGAHATVVVETPAAKSRYTEEHTEGNPFARKGRKGGAGGSGGKVQKTKTIPASGKRIVGYAVRVFAGGKLVGESYSEPSLKGKVGG